jgi:ATP-dependent DNA helicase RecG
LCKVKNGIFQNINSSTIEQLEKSGLIVKASTHSSKYTLSKAYDRLVKEDLTISKKYLVKEIELLLSELQGKALKISELAERMKNTSSRSQVRYLLQKLIEDRVIKTEGQIKGTRYLLTEQFSDMRGDLLRTEVLSFLRNRYQ